MSIINMSMGYFDISIDVTRNRARRKEINCHSIKNDQKMKKAMQETKDIAQNFYQLNIF